MKMADAHHDVLDFLADHIGCSTDDVLDFFGPKPKKRDKGKKALDELVHEGQVQGNRDFNKEGEFWTDLTLVTPGGTAT
jgi:hypothetical protein